MARESQNHDAEALARWAERTAPDIDTFRAIANEAFAGLPDEFRRRCEGILIRIEDFATREMLDSVDVDDPYDLLGLFEGVGYAQTGGTFGTGQSPNRIWLFRRAILDYWAAYEETLGAIIAHVLIHEIGHHFGLSDEDMEAIEAASG